MSERNRRLIALPLAGLILMAGLLAFAARPARADVAPIPQTGEAGYALGPGNPTTVQMVSETVLLEVADALVFTAAENQFEAERPGALVTADFLFHNPESGVQRLLVGFPLLVPPAFAPNSFPESATYAIEDLQAVINGQAAATRQALVGGQPWRVWDMDFPPGESTVRVTYRMPASSPDSWGPAITLGYVLQTGAGWLGVIQRAEVIVRFPYPAEALFIESAPAGYAVSGFDLRRVYENLEPSAQDDVVVTVIAPAAWRAVLEARQAVTAAPSAAHYAGLARAYSDLFLPSRGPYLPEAGPRFSNAELVQVAEAQLLKALELEPDNGLWHGQYAQFLASLAGSVLPEARYAEAFAEYARALSLGTDSWYADEYAFILEYSGERLPAGAGATATAVSQITPPPSVTPAPTMPASATPPSTATVAATTAATAAPPTRPAASATPAAPLAPTIAPTGAEADPAAPAENPWPAVIGFGLGFLILVGGLSLWRRRRQP